MRHGLEFPPRDALQRLAGLERDTIPRDLDLDRRAGARLDIQSRFRVRRGGEFAESGEVARVVGVAHGYRRDLARFVDEHCAGEAGETPVIQVGCAPVVVAATVLLL